MKKALQVNIIYTESLCITLVGLETGRIHINRELILPVVREKLWHFSLVPLSCATNIYDTEVG